MKRASAPWTLNVGCWTLVLSCFSAGFVPALAITAESPYGTIVERNAFALKPPPPPVVATPPAPPASNVELRGITTLLGRPQVLLNFKLPPKPPEPPKDRSLVMDVGQREGEVEVLGIDSASGSVRIRNQGNELSLNLKDNAAKPQFAPGAGPANVLPPPLPGVNPPAGMPQPPAVAPAATPTLPTRSLRSQNSEVGAGSASLGGGASLNGSPAEQQASMRTIEANVALYEANRLKNEELIKAGAKIPRMPVHALLREAPPEAK